jgi:hypothetical protein
LAFLLPELQDARGMARMLAVRARLQISAGRYDDAIETLRFGYQLAHDVAEPPTLVNALVGIAIASIMNDQLLALIQAPGAPNLYWALAGLPHPLVDMRPAFAYEMTMPARVFAFLKDAESAQRSPEEWRMLLIRAAKDIVKLSGGPVFRDGSVPEWLMELSVTGLALVGYPRAKQELIADGYSAQQVEKMAVAQAITVHQTRVHQYMYHEVFKWSLLPYSEGLAGFEQSEKKLGREGFFGRPGLSREIIPVTGLLLPAVSAAKHAEVRLATQLAGLRTLEAIRMHAAVRQGQLPKSLSEITTAPVPNDPATGKPFAYQLEGDRAILEIPDRRIPSAGWRLEITIRPPRG